MPVEMQSLLYNRYRILAELGRGGMGTVYRAHDENLGVDVAIKENLFVSPQFAQQFRREASLLAGLRHPNLPRVTDHFVIPGQGQYLVMDFVAGDDAGQRFKQLNRPLPERDVVAWAADILDALHYLHSRQPPVVHRDIKPGNIKITPEGRAVLVDFGLAKAQDSAQATATGAKGLSPGFSPPEQYGSGRTEARSDLYSVGATMYALLAGQKPADSLERALGHALLTPPRQLNPLISARTAAAIERAMALQPDGRFASAAEFLAALPRDDRTALRKLELNKAPPPPPPAAVTGQATSPATPVAAPAAAPPVAQRAAAAPVAAGRAAVIPAAKQARPAGRGWLWLAVLVVLLLVAGLGAGGGLLAINIFALRRTPTPGLPAAPSPTTLVVAATGTAPAPSATLAVVAATPAASGASPDKATSTRAPSVTPAPSKTATTTPSVAPSPSTTPAGGGAGQIAFVSERSGKPQIYLINSDGTHLTQLTNDADGACEPAWSPDGAQLLFVAPCTGKRDSYPGSAIYLAASDGSGVRPLITLLGGAYDPSWSVAGIAFVHPDGNRPQIYTAHADGSGYKDISTAHADDSQPSWSPDGKRLAFANLSRSGRPTIYWMFADGSFRPGFGNPDAVTRDVDASAPAWSPNGQFVAFLSGNAQIMVAAWDKFGFGLTTLTAVGPNAHPAWSPDSQWIAFESWRDAARHDIYRMTFNGGQVTRLTNDPALDYQPAWRPR